MALCPRSVLITGANRGLGLEFVKQFLSLPKPPEILIATCRDLDKAESLNKIAKENPSLKVLKLDVGDTAALDGFRNEVEGLVQSQGLNLLLNNAGIHIRKDLQQSEGDMLMENFRINVVAPFNIIKTFLPLLKMAAQNSSIQGLSCNKAAVINISSILGSIENNKTGGLYPYRTSKAALNMVTKSLSVDVRNDGILVTSIHPGWVQTDMGGAHADLTVTQSIEGCLQTFSKLNSESSGLMYDYLGKILSY